MELLEFIGRLVIVATVGGFWAHMFAYHFK